LASWPWDNGEVELDAKGGEIAGLAEKDWQVIQSNIYKLGRLKKAMQGPRACISELSAS